MSASKRLAHDAFRSAHGSIEGKSSASLAAASHTVLVLTHTHTLGRRRLTCVRSDSYDIARSRYSFHAYNIDVYYFQHASLHM